MGDMLYSPGSQSMDGNVFSSIAAANVHSQKLKDEARQLSDETLPELTARLKEKRFLLSPDRKYAIIMGPYESVSLCQKRVNGFPEEMSVSTVSDQVYSIEGKQIKSALIKHAATLLQLFEKMESHKNYRSDPVEEHHFFPSREEWS
jgi:hypothetical protein